MSYSINLTGGLEPYISAMAAVAESSRLPCDIVKQPDLRGFSHTLKFPDKDKGEERVAYGSSGTITMRTDINGIEVSGIGYPIKVSTSKFNKASSALHMAMEKAAERVYGPVENHYLYKQLERAVNEVTSLFDLAEVEKEIGNKFVFAVTLVDEHKKYLARVLNESENKQQLISAISALRKATKAMKGGVK